MVVILLLRLPTIPSADIPGDLCRYLREKLRLFGITFFGKLGRTVVDMGESAAS